MHIFVYVHIHIYIYVYMYTCMYISQGWKDLFAFEEGGQRGGSHSFDQRQTLSKRVLEVWGAIHLLWC